MKEENGLLIYNADDEEPDCGKCDNCDGDSEYYCVHSCGPEHGWNGYERTERYGDVISEAFINNRHNTVKERNDALLRRLEGENERNNCC